MANRVKGETSLVLKDGRSFTLVVGMRAMIAAEDFRDTSFEALMGGMAAGRLGAIAALVRGALVRFHPELTEDDVLDMLDTDRAAIMDALEDSLILAFPDAKPGASAEGKGSGPDGTSSGDSGAKPGSTRTASGRQPRARSSSKSPRA